MFMTCLWLLCKRKIINTVLYSNYSIIIIIIIIVIIIIRAWKEGGAIGSNGKVGARAGL